MGGGGTNTVTTESAPQLLPEAYPGYMAAAQYWLSQLANPSFYRGGPAPGQEQSFRQAQNWFSSPLYQPGGADEKAAVASLSEPIYSRFYSETLPGLRDRALGAGQVTGSTRRDVGEGAALKDFGYGLSTGAIAPIYGMRPQFAMADVVRNKALLESGTAERDIYKSIYESALGQQEQAASALYGASNVGRAGGSTMTGSETPGVMSSVSSGLSAAATAALIAKVLAA